MMRYLFHPISIATGILFCVIWSTFGARCGGRLPNPGACLCILVAVSGVLGFALLILLAPGYSNN